MGPTTSQAQKSHLEMYVAKPFPILPVPPVSGNAPMDPTSSWDVGIFASLASVLKKGKLSHGVALSSLYVSAVLCL